MWVSEGLKHFSWIRFLWWNCIKEMVTSGVEDQRNLVLTSSWFTFYRQWSYTQVREQACPQHWQYTECYTNRNLSTVSLQLSSGMMFNPLVFSFLSQTLLQFLTNAMQGSLKSFLLQRLPSKWLCRNILAIWREEAIRKLGRVPICASRAAERLSLPDLTRPRGEAGHDLVLSHCPKIVLLWIVLHLEQSIRLSKDCPPCAVFFFDQSVRFWAQNITREVKWGIGGKNV